GLKLNINTYEFISDSGTPATSSFQDFIHLLPGSATLLGAPLSVGKAMDDSVTKRCNELSLAITRLKSLSAHDALIWLKASFSAPKVLHTIRSSPCVAHNSLFSMFRPF